MNWRRIIVIALVVVVIVAVALFVLQRPSGQEEETVAETTPGDVDSLAIETGVDTVGAEGIVVPLRDTALTFPISGQVAEIFVTEGELVSDGDPLLRLDSTDQEVALQQAEAALAEAELAVSQAEAGVAQAEAGLLQAQATAGAAQSALDLMTLNAPFEGIVADIPLELGEVASQIRPAVVIADFDGWLVETSDLKEQDVVALAVGFPVEISVDALPGETLQGTVIDVSPVSRIVDGDVTYVVTIRLDETGDLPLRWGMTTSVEIDTNQS